MKRGCCGLTVTVLVVLVLSATPSPAPGPTPETWTDPVAGVELVKIPAGC